MQQGLSMPPSPATEVISSTGFDPFPNDAMMAVATKTSNSSTATESVSSDNMQPASPQRDSRRMLPESPHRSPARSYRSGSPQRSPNINTNSPIEQGSPSDRGMVHTRTNFGKTRSYVPPVMPSTSPGAGGGRIAMDAPPAVPPSPRGNKSHMTPFLEDEEDAPDDEAQFRTVRSLRPKPGQDGTLRSGRLRRQNSATKDVTEASPRPEAYISETDESSFLGNLDLSYESRPVPSSSSLRSRDARQPSPEAPFDMIPKRSGSKERRHPSPIENISASPIRSTKKQVQQGDDMSPTNSPNRLSVEEIGELRRRRRRIKNRRALKPPAPESQQFDMPAPTAEAPPPMRVTATKTSDLTDDTELDPIPSFDAENSGVRKVVKSEMEDHEEGDTTAVPPAPAESPLYEEFEPERDASVSPQKAKPKSILRTKRTMSQASDDNDADDDGGDDEDDDSLFNFGSGSGNQNMALGAGTSIRKSALKSGTNSSNRKGRRPRRRSDEASIDDDESLIQYGEVRQHDSSLQERTQEAWTFRSKRSFSATSPKKESAGVQFGNTNTVHHFADDQQSVGTGASMHSFNSLYTKSPESEAEDLIKDLLMIGSGEHSNPGRRKLKYQPEYKRQLRERGDERSVDDNTLGTTDISLNTLDQNAGTRTFTEVVPAPEVKEDTAPRKGNDGASSMSVCETLDSKSASNEGGEDPLAIVWGYVESGMQALGFADVPPEENEVEDKEKKNPKVVEEQAPQEAAPEPSEKETPPEEEEIAAKATEDESLEVAKSSELEGIGESGTGDDLFVDEAKEEENKGSFNEVMEYIFGDPVQNKQKEKESAAASTISATTSTTPLEEDPRLEELALHAVKSKHQMYDLVYDDKFPFDLEKDIKFSLVKTKLPLGILFHENDGGCWITKVFPDGNAAKAGGVEVGDQLAAINGISAIKLRVDQICTLITEAPDPENIELTFLRYVGQLHPVVPEEPEEIHEESLEVATAAIPPTKRPTPQKKISLKALPKLRTRDPSPKPDRSPKRSTEPSQKSAKTETKGRKKLGKWFGKGKKKSQAAA